MSKPIVVHGHPRGPNPWKVAIILEELGLQYEYRVHSFEDVKKPAYENINPNGRYVTPPLCCCFQLGIDTFSPLQRACH